MKNKNIYDIEFNDIAFIENEGRKAIVIYGKTQKTANALYLALKEKGFDLKHRVEKSGFYTICIDVKSYSNKLILETKLNKTNFPKLIWIDNSNIGWLVVAYKDGNNTQLIEPPLPIVSYTHPN